MQDKELPKNMGKKIVDALKQQDFDDSSETNADDIINSFSDDDDELSLAIKPIHRLSTTRDFDKFKAFAKSIAFYLEDELETPVGILDYVNFGENKLKEEMQKPLYVVWNYRLQTITVTLNK